MATWFTPARRKAIYALAASLLTVAGVYGAVSADKQAAILDLVKAALAVLPLILAALNVPLDAQSSDQAANSDLDVGNYPVDGTDAE